MVAAIYDSPESISLYLPSGELSGGVSLTGPPPLTTATDAERVVVGFAGLFEFRLKIATNSLLPVMKDDGTESAAKSAPTRAPGSSFSGD